MAHPRKTRPQRQREKNAYDRLTKETNRLTKEISEKYGVSYFILSYHKYVISCFVYHVIQELQECFRNNIAKKQQEPAFAVTLELAFNLLDAPRAMFDGGPHLLTPLLPEGSRDDFGLTVNSDDCCDRLSYVTTTTRLPLGPDNWPQVITVTVYVVLALNRNRFTEALYEKSNDWIVFGCGTPPTYVSLKDTSDDNLRVLIKNGIKRYVNETLNTLYSKDYQWTEIKIYDYGEEVEIFDISWQSPDMTREILNKLRQELDGDFEPQLIVPHSLKGSKTQGRTRKMI